MMGQNGGSALEIECATRRLLVFKALWLFT